MLYDVNATNCKVALPTVHTELKDGRYTAVLVDPTSLRLSRLYQSFMVDTYLELCVCGGRGGYSHAGRPLSSPESAVMLSKFQNSI